jgi:hypothetical protein
VSEEWIQELVNLLKDKGITMDSEIMARAQYVSDMARRTVWVRQRTDHKWEAIDWMGRVVGQSRYRVALEHDLTQMASMPISNIHAIAKVVPPSNRQPNRKVKVKGRYCV